MLVSVDEAAGMVHILGGAGVSASVPISDVATLFRMLSGQTVRYVSEVVEVSGEEVLDLIGTLAPYAPAFISPVSRPQNWNVSATPGVAQRSAADDGKRWLHATGSGQLNFEAGGVTVTFRDRADFKPVEKFGGDRMGERYPVIGALLRSGKLEVVSTPRMNEIRREHRQKQEAFERLRQNGIVLDQPVKSLNLRNMAESLDARGDVRLAAQAVAERAEVVDMDDYSDPADDPSAMLSEDQLMALQAGWGKRDGGEPDDGGQHGEE